MERPNRALRKSGGGVIRFLLVTFILLVLAPILLPSIASTGPSSVEIRLDTGDLRYYWFGIKGRVEPMPEPYRSRLLALSAIPPAVREKWVTCGVVPHDNQHNPEGFYESSYVKVAEWAERDEKLARLLLLDLIEGTKKSSLSNEIRAPLYEAISVIRYEEFRGDSFKGWRDDPEVRRYCGDRGYVLPAAP